MASKLKNRISVLEEDKRNLEDTVSARMTMITSGFSGMNSDMLSMTSDAQEVDLKQKFEASENERLRLENNVRSLRADLATVPGRIEAEKRALTASLSAKFESQEHEWKQKLEMFASRATDNLLNRLSIAMQTDFSSEDFQNLSSDDKV